MEREPVVLVHGILVRSYVMKRLAQGLRRLHYPVLNYSYPSRRYPLTEQAEHLADYIQTHTSSPVAVVAHSMGGVLLRHLVDRYPNLLSKAVTISSPHQGSLLAKHLFHSRWHWLLGKTFSRGLDGELPPWPDEIPLAGLTGNHSMGLGRLFMRYEDANDGSVRVEEAHLDAMCAWRVLPYSHTGILFADETLEEIDYFFRFGCFSSP